MQEVYKKTAWDNYPSGNRGTTKSHTTEQIKAHALA